LGKDYPGHLYGSINKIRFAGFRAGTNVCRVEADFGLN
jgi:hypothetical protein